MIELTAEEQKFVASLDRVATEHATTNPELAKAVLELRERIDRARDRKMLSGDLVDTFLVFRLVFEKEFDRMRRFMESLFGDLPAPSSPEINKQYDAYNAGDLDAFCGCFAEDIVMEIFDPEGKLEKSIEGKDDFRARFAERFTTSLTTAIITHREVDGRTTTEKETAIWTDRKSGQRTVIYVTVSYTINDEGKICLTQLRDMKIEQSPER